MNPIKNIQNAVLAGLIAITMIRMALVWPFSQDSHDMSLPGIGERKHITWHADSLGQKRQFTDVHIMRVTEDSFRIHIPGVMPVVGMLLDKDLFIDTGFIKFETPAYENPRAEYGDLLYLTDWMVIMSETNLEVREYASSRHWKRSYQLGQ